MATPEPAWPSGANFYEKVHLIGSGSSAQVYICKTNDGRKCAVKILNLEAHQVVDDCFEEIRKELQAMSQCRHPNIIQHHVAFPFKRQMYVVMPLMAGGSCADLLRCMYPNGWGATEEAVIAHVLYETLQALAYLHDPKQAQIHRDLKAGNLLLRTDGCVCLADFGVAASVRDQTMRQTFVGTPCWMAPEVLGQDGGYNYKADIWGLGVTAFELAHGEAPYQRLHPLKVMRNILDKPPPNVTAGSAIFQGLVGTCLVKDPQQRPTAESLLANNTAFFQQRNVNRLREIIRAAPPLEARRPAVLAPVSNHFLYHSAPAGGSSSQNISSRVAHSQNSDWDFDLPEEEAELDFWPQVGLLDGKEGDRLGCANGVVTASNAPGTVLEPGEPNAGEGDALPPYVPQRPSPPALPPQDVASPGAPAAPEATLGAAPPAPPAPPAPAPAPPAGDPAG